MGQAAGASAIKQRKSGDCIMTKTKSTTLLSMLVLLCGATKAAWGQVQSLPKQRDASQEKTIQLPSRAVQAQTQVNFTQLKQELLHAKPDKFGPKVANPN